MKKTLLFIILFFVLFLFSSSAFAANYYVSTTGSNETGDGSVGNPWKTITFSITQMSNEDILNIKALLPTAKTSLKMDEEQNMLYRIIKK